ncbi:MAG: type I glyceraldehyde-3-phosphate dehydrogenase [Candidatus Bathyarchaeia archaeon]
MGVKVAINGFGRTGRLALRAALERKSELDFVAVNRGKAETLAHLLKYDTVHGKTPFEVQCVGDYIVADDQKMLALYESNPEKLPWEELEVDLVIESSGRFKDREGASKHLDAGAEKVLISAPAKNPDITVVRGVNDEIYDPDVHDIVSNASCTTNCVAVVAKVLNDEYGIEKGFMSTIHAYTSNQMILDRSHKDLRRARAAAANIIPTTTGAAVATGLVIPELEGKIDGMAFRVPVTNVSIVDLVAILNEKATVEEVNQTMMIASKGDLEEILGFTDEPLVSSDYIHDPRSAILDSLSTMTVENMTKVIAWYDNEWGYCCRLVEMAEKIAEHM